MSVVAFHLDGPGVAVPVEIYNEELAPVARGLSSHAVELEAGSYHLVVRPPGGPGQASSFVVEADAEMVVALPSAGPTGGGERSGRPTRSPDPGATGPSALPSGEHDELLRDVVGRSVGRRGPRLDGWDALPVRGFDPLGGWELTSVRSTGWPGEVPAVELRLIDGRHAPRCTVLPVAAMRFVAPAVAAGPDGGPRLEARLVHAVGAAVGTYLRRGQVLDAALLAGDQLLSDDLLETKRGDPVAAVAGAFALLALGPSWGMHVWTRDLDRTFPWLADGLVARAEHHALSGEHRRAAELLKRLAERGLPCLTVALTTAVDRLGSYVGTDLDDRRLREAHQRLARYAIACDLTATVTTFDAHEPDAPLPRVAPDLS